MLGKIIILIFFVVILYNLFMGLKLLTQSKPDSAGLLIKLRRRIITSVLLFAFIIIGFLTGLVPLHTL